jgi:hypothetical protein
MAGLEGTDRASDTLNGKVGGTTTREGVTGTSLRMTWRLSSQMVTTLSGTPNGQS